MAQLEKMLSESTAKRKLILSDAVFSMDGDLAPTNELLNWLKNTMPGSCSTMRTVSAYWARKAVVH